MVSAAPPAEQINRKSPGKLPGLSFCFRRSFPQGLAHTAQGFNPLNAGICGGARYAYFNPTSRAVLSPRGLDGDGAGRKGKALVSKRKKKLRQSGWEKKTATVVQLVQGCVRLIAAITKLAQMLDDWTL